MTTHLGIYQVYDLFFRMWLLREWESEHISVWGWKKLGNYLIFFIKSLVCTEINTIFAQWFIIFLLCRPPEMKAFEHYYIYLLWERNRISHAKGPIWSLRRGYTPWEVPQACCNRFRLIVPRTPARTGTRPWIARAAVASGKAFGISATAGTPLPPTFATDYSFLSKSLWYIKGIF